MRAGQGKLRRYVSPVVQGAERLFGGACGRLVADLAVIVAPATQAESVGVAHAVSGNLDNRGPRADALMVVFASLDAQLTPIGAEGNSGFDAGAVALVGGCERGAVDHAHGVCSSCAGRAGRVMVRGLRQSARGARAGRGRASGRTLRHACARSSAVQSAQRS